MFGIKDANQNKDLINLINQFDTTILGIENVKAQINGKKINTYTLVYTPIGFFIISRLNLMRKCKAKIVVSLFDIIGFDFKSKNEILCRFGNSQTILLEIDNYKPFIQSILDHHSQMFYRSPFIKPIELNNFPESLHPTQPISPPSNIISLRYISICAKYQQPIDPETKHIFEIYEKSDKLSITFNFKCQPPINYHFISSPLMHEPLLHGLIFDQYSPHNVCKIIYSLLKYNKNIISIIMRNYNDLTYEQFGFSNLKNPSVVSWHFSNLSLTDQRLSLFFMEFKSYQGDLIQLSLDHIHFTTTSADRLAKLIAFHHCFRSLEVFNLTYIDGCGQNINKILNSFQKTVSQLRSLQKVTFANWNPQPSITSPPKPPNVKSSIQIPFQFIRTTSVRYLSLISFDLRMVNYKIVLPSNINCLELRKCKFNCCSLMNVLEAALSINSPCILSLAEMEIDNGELQQFYQESSKIQSFKNLVEFDYSCNSIPTHFVKEFNRIFISPSLKFLSLNNVFGPNQITELAAVLAACETNCQLWGLELMGGKIKRTIGPKLKEVFPFIIPQTQLEHLNISAQQFTDMIINDVYNFFDSMKNLLYLSVDGSAINKLQTLFDFYEHIFVKTRSRAITRPFMDLDSLIIGNNVEETIHSSMFLTFKQRMLSQMTPSDRFIRTFYYIRYPDMNRFQTFLSVFPLAATELPSNDKYGINCITQTSIPLRSLSDFDFQEIRTAEEIGTYQASLFHSPFDYVPPIKSELKSFELPPALKKFKGSYVYDANLTRPEIKKKVKPREIVHRYQGMINVKNKPLFRNLTIIEDLFDNIKNMEIINGDENLDSNRNNLNGLFNLPKLEPPVIIPKEAFEIIVEQMETLEDPTVESENDLSDKKLSLTSKSRIVSATQSLCSSLRTNKLSSGSNVFHLNSSMSSNELPFIKSNIASPLLSIVPIYETASDARIMASSSDPPIALDANSTFLTDDENDESDEYYDDDDEDLFYSFLIDNYENRKRKTQMLPELPSTKILQATKYGDPDTFFLMTNSPKNHDFDCEYESDDENISDDDEQLELLQVMISDPLQQETLQNLRQTSYQFNKIDPKSASKIRAIPNDPPKEDPKMPKFFDSLYQNKKKYCFRITSTSNYRMKHRSSSSAANLINFVSRDERSSSAAVGVTSGVAVNDFIDTAAINSSSNYDTLQSSSSGINIPSITDHHFEFDHQEHHRLSQKRTNSSALNSQPIARNASSQLKMSQRFRTAPNNSNNSSFSSILSNISFNTPVQSNLMELSQIENESSEDGLMPDTVVNPSQPSQFNLNGSFKYSMNMGQKGNVQASSVTFAVDESSSSGEMLIDDADNAAKPKSLQKQNTVKTATVAPPVNAKVNSARKDVQCFSSDSGEASDDGQVKKTVMLNNKNNSYSSNSGEASDGMAPPPDSQSAKKAQQQAMPKTVQKAASYSSNSGEASDDMMPPPDAQQVKKTQAQQQVRSQTVQKAASYSSNSGEASDDMMPPPDAQQVKKIAYPDFGQNQTQVKAPQTQTQPAKAASYSSNSGEASDDMMPPPDAQQVKKIAYPNFGQNQTQFQAPQTQTQPAKAASYSSNSGEASDDMMPPPDAQQVKKISYPNFGQNQTQVKAPQTQPQPAKAASYSSNSGEASDDMMPPPDAQQVKKITYPNFGQNQTQFQAPQTQTQKAASYSSNSGEASDDMMPPSDAQPTRKITYPSFSSDTNQPQQSQQPPQPAPGPASYSSNSGEASDDMMPPPDAQPLRKIEYPNFGASQQQQQQQQAPPMAASYSSNSGEASDDMMPPPDVEPPRKIDYPKF
ncbi:hypothetical protein M9Y10_010423 [Tritrichomonas musculus]|uniref:Uncharacterized protein n=1 Tax=Tritrichomonas musculus TaxID=1915356 RepID=A0ABR2ILK5_9EUKA